MTPDQVTAHMASLTTAQAIRFGRSLIRSCMTVDTEAFNRANREFGPAAIRAAREVNRAVGPSYMLYAVRAA